MSDIKKFRVDNSVRKIEGVEGGPGLKEPFAGEQIIYLNQPWDAPKCFHSSRYNAGLPLWCQEHVIDEGPRQGLMFEEVVMGQSLAFDCVPGNCYETWSRCSRWSNWGTGRVWKTCFDRYK